MFHILYIYIKIDTYNLKLQSITILVKNDPKSIFEQVHNQPVVKIITLHYLM